MSAQDTENQIGGFREVAEANLGASVTIITKAKIDTLMNRRKRKSWWRTGTMWDRRMNRE